MLIDGVSQTIDAIKKLLRLQGRLGKQATLEIISSLCHYSFLEIQFFHRL